MPMWPLHVKVAAVALVTSVLPSPAAAVAPREVRFLQFNICGAICHHGEVDAPGADVVEHVRDVVVQARADVVVLNEVCGAQLARLRRLLEGSGRPMSGAFHAQREDTRCGGGFGDAVLSAGPTGPAQVHRLPNHPSGGERRSLLCVPTVVGSRVLACGLHLVAAAPEWNRRQLEAVTREVRRRSRWVTVVVAGDFNVVPSGMGGLTDGRRGGFLDDVDGARQRATHFGRKIDYILLDGRAFRDLAADVRTSGWSDHRILVGRATLR